MNLTSDQCFIEYKIIWRMIQKKYIVLDEKIQVSSKVLDIS